MPIVDASSFVGQWPFRPSWLAQPEAIVGAAHEGRISACLVAPVAALLLDDPSATNEALYRIAARWDELRPVAMWNPSMPGCEAVIADAKAAAAPAVKLAPAYHHYAPDPEALAPALDALEESGMVACIQLRVEDARQMRFQVPDIAMAEALALAAARPGIRWVMCGARTVEIQAGAEQAARDGNVWFELSGTDGLACVEHLAAKVRPDRLLFATHMPFYYPEANHLKFVEADLADDVREAILGLNACDLFGIKPSA